MPGTIPEPRTPVMILAEAYWEDQGGPHAGRAWIENKSVGGACVRVKTPINVGSKLTVQGRWEQITGVTKYCRKTGKEYLVGIQRDPGVSFIPDHPVPANLPMRERTSEDEEIIQERKPMQRKWSELVHRHDKRDEVSGDAANAGIGHLPPALATETVREPQRNAGTQFHIELLSPDDVYRTAGVMNLRRGFSVSRVAGILHGDRARNLPKEARQAVVLMALDAAGVEVDEVLQDAKTREQALNSYEAELRKELEAEWAQKAEENVQIQGELERAKAHYMARISRNLEGVARQKAALDHWLKLKQEESQRIAEAAELCLKSPQPDAISRPAASPAADQDSA